MITTRPLLHNLPVPSIPDDDSPSSKATPSRHFYELRCAGTTKFVPGACDRLEPFLMQNIVGQDLALHQLVDAVCTHLATAHHKKPLILSVHGPPGVGKTFTHTLLARALYNKQPETAIKCPGEDCAGAKVGFSPCSHASPCSPPCEHGPSMHSHTSMIHLLHHVIDFLSKNKDICGCLVVCFSQSMPTMPTMPACPMCPGTVRSSCTMAPHAPWLGMHHAT